MLLRLFDIAVCGFEFYMNYHLMSHFLRKRSLRRTTVISTMLGMTAVLYLINTIFHVFWINSLAMFVLLYIFSSTLFVKQMGKCLLLSLVSTAICVLSEFLTAFAASSVLVDGLAEHMQMLSYIPFFTILSKMIQFVIIRIIVLFVGQERYDTESKESGYLLLCPLLAIVNMYFLLYMDIGRPTHKIEHAFIFSLGVGWAIVSIILLKIYNTALERHDLSNQLKMIHLEKAAEYEYIQRQKMNELTLRKILHDIKNQLVNVRHIVGTDPEQGDQYLSALIGSLQYGQQMEITTDYKNLVINQILNKNRSICDRLGIDLQLQIEYDNFQFLGFLDTSAILDNAFDNAITACNQIPNDKPRYICLRIYRHGDTLVLIMKNSRENSLVIGDEKLLSSKFKSQNHGFGISSIKTAASHYAGIVAIETPANEFILTVTLNMNKE